MLVGICRCGVLVGMQVCRVFEHSRTNSHFWWCYIFSFLMFQSVRVYCWKFVDLQVYGFDYYWQGMGVEDIVRDLGEDCNLFGLLVKLQPMKFDGCYKG